MKLAGKILGAVAVLAIHSSGHDVITTQITFSREISRLIYSRCASCHRPGGAAFSLLTYEEARPWAKAIQEEVLERRMPPWGAVKGFGDFRDDQGLTQEQIELIAEWVDGGAPEGDPKLLPTVPVSHAKRAETKPAPGIQVEGSLTLKSASKVTGIRVNNAGSFMAVAKLPDGSTEPLLWLYQYNPRFDHPFIYKDALSLPAGTTIEISPAGTGSVTLLLAPRPQNRDRKGL